MANYPAGYRPAYPPPQRGGSRKGGACSSFLLVLTGMILGVVLFVGIIAGGAYYVINNVTMDKVLELTNLSTKLDLPDNFGATLTEDPDTGEITVGEDGINLGSLTALEYITEIKNTLPEIKEKPLCELTGLFGIKLPEEILGMSTEELKYKKISELSVDTFTLEQIFSIIGTEMSIPAFENRKALTISGALSEINALFENDLTLAQIEYEFGVKLVKDPVEGVEDDPITALLRGCQATGSAVCADTTPCIKHTPLSGLGEKLNAEIQLMEISDFVTVDANSHPIMVAMSDLSVEELGAGPDPNTGKSPLQLKIDALTLNDFMEISPSSHPIILNISDLTVEELSSSTALQDKINAMTLGDIIKAKDGETEHPLFTKLKDKTIGNMNEALTDAIDNLVITDIFTGELTGVLSLFETCSDPLTCDHCDGVGDFCTACSGTGEIVCPTCGGTDPECLTCSGTGVVVCSDCNGTHCTVHTNPHGEDGQHFCARSVSIKQMPAVLTYLVNNATLLELKVAGIFNADIPTFMQTYTIGDAMTKLATMETEDPELYKLLKAYFEPWTIVWINAAPGTTTVSGKYCEIGGEVTLSVDPGYLNYTVYAYDKTIAGDFYDDTSTPLIETTLITTPGTITFTMPNNNKGIVVVIRTL